MPKDFNPFDPLGLFDKVKGPPDPLGVFKRKPEWTASITSFGLTVEGDTEQEAIDDAKGYLRVPAVFTIRVTRVIS